MLQKGKERKVYYTRKGSLAYFAEKGVQGILRKNRKLRMHCSKGMNLIYSVQKELEAMHKKKLRVHCSKSMNLVCNEQKKLEAIYKKKLRVHCSKGMNSVYNVQKELEAMLKRSLWYTR